MNNNCITTQKAKRVAEIIRREKVTVLPIINDTNELAEVGCAYEPFADAGKEKKEQLCSIGPPVSQ